MSGAIGSRIFEGSLPITEFDVTLGVEVGDSDKHMSVRTGEGQQVSQGLAEKVSGWTFREEERRDQRSPGRDHGQGLVSYRSETIWHPDLRGQHSLAALDHILFWLMGTLMSSEMMGSCMFQ